MNVQLLCERFGVAGPVREAALRAQERVAGIPYAAQERVKANVMAAFLEEGVTESDFSGTLGYGYDDAARAKYEALLARIFGAERALARLSFVSGTHAIVTAIAACVPPGKTLLSLTGRPYDTLRNAIADAPNSLVRAGMQYKELDPSIPQGALRQAQDDNPIPHHDKDVAAVFVQRSRGYAPRPSLSIAECASLFAQIKKKRPDVAIIVDNCYGELVEDREPTHIGADLAIGSLIKNLGGSLAPAGGYVIGRSDLVARVADRLYAPGLGDALGPSLGFGRAFLQGLFMAPLIVEQCLRGLDFAAALFDELGYPVDPAAGAARTDIVQAIRLGSARSIRLFAQGLQSALPVNARFRPEPGSVPGYAEPVVMSSGSFISGATIELSCDAPLREPFEVYLQGGVVAEHAVLGALFAARAVQGGSLSREKRDRA
ncbi:MAG TPA: methionine gamma-lyase family protein [Candidatus Rubrimentiphilum sp.]|nr:methionine gamma-lyase family protein [Candidatus Rubrimentiphilum sp.]